MTFDPRDAAQPLGGNIKGTSGHSWTDCSLPIEVNPARTLKIVIEPTRSGRKWIARLDDRLLCVTVWPFVKSARLLLAEGYPADTVAEIWCPNTDDGRCEAASARPPRRSSKVNSVALRHVVDKYNSDENADFHQIVASRHPRHVARCRRHREQCRPYAAELSDPSRDVGRHALAIGIDQRERRPPRAVADVVGGSGDHVGLSDGLTEYLQVAQATYPNKITISGPKLRVALDISAPTLWRWRHDKDSEFPKAKSINGRLYFHWQEVQAWLGRQPDAARLARKGDHRRGVS